MTLLLVTADQRPTPGDHEIAGDMCWDEDKKIFIMSPKGKTWPYGARGTYVEQHAIKGSVYYTSMLFY